MKLSDIKGRIIPFEIEKDKDDLAIIKVDSKDVEVFGRGSKGECIKLFYKDNEIEVREVSRDNTMYLHSYHIGNGWAKYHTFVYYRFLMNKDLILVKW